MLPNVWLFIGSPLLSLFTAVSNAGSMIPLETPSQATAVLTGWSWVWCLRGARLAPWTLLYATFGVSNLENGIIAHLDSPFLPIRPLVASVLSKSAREYHFNVRQPVIIAS